MQGAPRKALDGGDVAAAKGRTQRLPQQQIDARSYRSRAHYCVSSGTKRGRAGGAGCDSISHIDAIER
jgi:hypothetical protein